MTHPVGRQNGPAIRAFREKEDLSVPQVAELLGLKNPQSLRNIENGRTPASSKVIWHLARILAVPPEAITRDGTGIGTEGPFAEAEEDPEPELARAS